MKTLAQNIKTKEFKSIYLLYGEEAFLKKSYKNQLRQAIVGDDTMNYHYFEGKGIDLKEIISLADTMPFFGEQRLIVIEDSGLFKSGGTENLVEYLPQMPKTTCMVFVESELDKRNRLYKKVKDLGYAAEMTRQNGKQLAAWAGGILAKEGKKITAHTMELFLSKTGDDMENIRMELEKLICKIYEDNVLGKLPDARYAALDAQYAKEQGELDTEIVQLEKAISTYEQTRKSAEKFIALVDKYENFDNLTTAMLNEFVEKILVHERDRKGSIETTQEIEIYFNFVGKYMPPHFGEVDLSPEELETLRKKEERKDRLHQNYLKRKASGWQREYYERTKSEKRRKMEEAKAAIRAEDMAKGVFIPASQLPKQEPKKAPAQTCAAV